MGKVVVVPGAAVREYVRPAVGTLRDRGIDAELLAAPGSPGAPADLARYGRELGARIEDRGDGPTDVLVGLSVGAQAAAVAATIPTRPRLGALMLVSPTTDPAARSALRLVGRWLRGGGREPPGLARYQLPDWRRAGPRRLVTLVRSALTVDIERLLPAIDVPVTVVHAEHDVITSHAWAAALGQRARLVVLPRATHSWPYRDEARFADLVQRVLAGADGIGAR